MKGWTILPNSACSTAPVCCKSAQGVYSSMETIACNSASGTIVADDFCSITPVCCKTAQVTELLPTIDCNSKNGQLVQECLCQNKSNPCACESNPWIPRTCPQLCGLPDDTLATECKCYNCGDIATTTLCQKLGDVRN